MPGPSQQLRFSQQPAWLCSQPVLNGQVRPPKPYAGVISREEPAIKTCIEKRRGDVGYQSYSSGSYEPIFVEKPVIGKLPTSSAVFFLRDQYPDSAQPIKPDRYYR
jgi:hypothetical protein